MPSYSPLTERIKGKGSEAWRVHQAGAKRAAAGEDIIFLSIGDPDFSTPEPIVERAVEALRGGDTITATLEAELPCVKPSSTDSIPTPGYQ